MSKPGKHESGREEKSRPVLARLAAHGARLGVALVIFGGVGLGVAALYGRGGDANAALPPTPPPVVTMTVEESPGHTELWRFAGRLEPARETALGFERGGLLTAILVEEGDRVAAGQVLARLNVALLDNERDRFEAIRRQQAARLELARLALSGVSAPGTV